MNQSVLTLLEQATVHGGEASEDASDALYVWENLSLNDAE